MLYLAKMTTLLAAVIGGVLLQSCTQDYDIASCINLDSIESEYTALLTDVLSPIDSEREEQETRSLGAIRAALRADESVLKLTFASVENRTSIDNLRLERDVGWTETNLFSGFSRELKNDFRKSREYRRLLDFARHEFVKTEGVYSSESMHTWETGLERGYMEFPKFEYDILRVTRYYVTQDKMYELVLTLNYDLVVQRVAACGADR